MDIMKKELEFASLQEELYTDIPIDEKIRMAKNKKEAPKNMQNKTEIER